MADTQVLEACASAWGFESPLPHHRINHYEHWLPDKGHRGPKLPIYVARGAESTFRTPRLRR